MLPKLELEVIAEASREVSVGDLEDEESSHLVDEAAAAKLAKSLPASADIAIRGDGSPLALPAFDCLCRCRPACQLRTVGGGVAPSGSSLLHRSHQASSEATPRPPRAAASADLHLVGGRQWRGRRRAALAPASLFVSLPLLVRAALLLLALLLRTR